ncbi:pantothenate kinase [Arboricoccus pini]|uniref:Pantothenate kinase n=1 Tax=Arboricoccus pini TaxID=1963835 RepID=A0A212RI30_9PROT|nr:type I pantothenate kinase [Arboricoccus pini]SNB72078.1 pantothenate kinase [Arboricoccus pini]
MDGTIDRDGYIAFPREAWSKLRANTPLPLQDAELEKLRGLNEPISMADVEDVYLPLARLLNLHIQAARGLHATVLANFLGTPVPPAPYVIGIAGSVGVGKSTFARLLRAVLARWPTHPRVDLITTDGFLLPTAVLQARGLMERKGFPESYDQRRMLAFLAALKAGEPNLRVPIYSHKIYDIVPDRVDIVDRPDILVFEGLNVLQTIPSASVVASDFFDFSIYLDARTEDIEHWFIERFLLLQRSAFQDPSSYFHALRDLPEPDARARARGIWQRINLPNLVQNILPTRERARLILQKGATHTIDTVRLRNV